MEHDLVIRGGTLVDGTGAPARTADVAMDDGRITDVGRVGIGREEIDADGAIVTPGFVDPHTHFDGQVTWDPLLTPSSWHGVTTAVLGNCGVGFAPVRPDRHDFLIQLMEGVEDIPGTALHAGIRWEWETFPEYLDALDRMPRSIDIGAQLPHGALRTYVMDDRGAEDQPATADDLALMAKHVAESIRAGAIGFSTNRLASHTAKDGRPVPGHVRLGRGAWRHRPRDGRRGWRSGGDHLVGRDGHEPRRLPGRRRVGRALLARVRSAGHALPHAGRQHPGVVA